ncbi:MAG: hypothetical protein PUF61_10955 [Spirochaetales bacterium]|nr:hypothetical protein [Spirochaetales bacterium]
MGFFSNRTKEEKVDNSEIGKLKRELEKQRVEKARAEAEMAYKEEQELARKLGIAKAFSIHDADSEKKILQTKLLEKWDNVFQRENIIDKLRFFETVEEKKRFIAESFSIELTNDVWKAEETNYLELIYETQGNQLVFKFSKKENSDSEFVLCLEYKTAQESDNIKTEITGTTNNSAQCKGLYGFLCSLNQPEMAAYMDAFFTKVKEAEQNKTEKEREQKLQAILAMNNQETASNAKRWKLEEGPAFSIHDIDAENKFLQTKLLEKWDDIFQKQNIIDELRFFENAKEKKRFIADTFSIELTCSYTWSELTSDIWNEMKSDTNCLELIYDLELVYESQGKQLFFKFSEKEDSDSDFELSFEYKPDQTSDNIKAVITGTADNPTKYTTLYNFLCSLDLPEIVEHMDVFFTKLKEAEQKLPNKKEIELNEKYSSILDDLSTL